MSKFQNFFFHSRQVPGRYGSDAVTELTPIWWKVIPAGILGFLTVVFLIACIFGSWFVVESGNRGVVTFMGKLEPDIYKDGVHFKLPILESAHEVSVKNRTFMSANLDAGSKDLQSVTSTAAITYYVPDFGVLNVYKNYRTVDNLETSVLQQSIEEVTKDVTSKYTAEELITKRDVVRDNILTALRIKLRPFYVEVKDVSITQFHFSRKFNEAIEAKVTAEQLALQAENDLKRITIVGEQTIATAKAQAEAIRIQSEAIQKQGGIGYVQLKFIEKWDGKLPTYGQVPTLFKGVSQ